MLLWSLWRHQPTHERRKGAKAPPAIKVQAEWLVKMISGDKAKLAIYCEIVRLSDEVDGAEQKKESKKAEAFYDRADELDKKLGPEYIASMEGPQDMEPNSTAGEEIASVPGELDKLCGK